MGLIKAITGSVGGVLAEQWKEFFYCEAIDEQVLVKKGQKQISGRSSNTKGENNIISNGSAIAVADGQCMIIVDNGKVVELCAEPGTFTYDSSTEPSIFSGDLGTGILETFKNIGTRFTYGGSPGKDQRVYYFNTKEITSNKYGTPSPVPFRVVDNNIDLDIDISIKCFGEYSYKIIDPMLFYTNVCGNISDEYLRSEIDGMLKTELLTALQPAFAKISSMGIRYSALPGHTMEIADALNEILSKKWAELRGLKIYSFGISSVTASEEDQNLIKELQRTAVMRNPNMAAATLVGAQAEAMKAAASNEGGMGSMMGFMGMNMAQNAGGMNANNLFTMGQGQQDNNVGQENQQQNIVSAGWTCSKGHQDNTGKFCKECGEAKPAPVTNWNCSCGAINSGKFCVECGTIKPQGPTFLVCDKCGFKSEENAKHKFCPECGDVFDSNDIK